ncbi:insulinase family protein [Granulosicoccus sp.]|nr:insulinase family protein [Granulosicoccus sp.]MDB4224348.1 insulinase family protein [Granulosicoccus sp.]
MNMPVSHPAFTHVRSEHIQSLNIDVHEYVHSATGTPHVHLATDNPENVFLVGLRTVPTDSTGVAHILEHTVLCGSEKYPVRDPFFMMIRRSLNTFMNAFTSSDWTAYPFASQNRKDYFNLLDVYLDAVFFSRLHELDFAQEGHRVEFEQADDPETDLVFKGIVFNEMKGAMSAPTSMLWQSLSKYLFPNNTYHFNSGGEPEDIPDLSYEQLKSFYDTHYHPSNAVFMTYGDIAPDVLQTKFEEQVLNRFEKLDRTIQVEPAKRYHSPMRVQEAYATQEEDTTDKTHIVVSWLLGESINLDDRLRSHLLSSVLLDNSASPLMRVLEQTDLGNSPSPLCGLEDSNREMVFACGLEGSNPDQTLAVEKMVLDVLESVARDGVPQEQVDAVLHQLELSQREIRGDGMPFGLQLVLSGLSSAMQRGDTLASIDLDPALERLRLASLEPDFIANLVKELLLDNPHRVTMTMAPDSAISERRIVAEKERLATMKSAMTDADKKRIVEQAQALAERQVQEDDPEILPKVTLADVPIDMYIPTSDSATIEGAPATLYAQGTNGIVYQHVVVELPQLEPELQAVLPLYTSFSAELGSGGRDYLDTQNVQAAVTGGIGTYIMQRGAVDDEQAVKGYMVVRGKALLRNSDALSGLMLDTLADLRFDETNRIKELVSQSRAGREQSITGSGHMLAMMAAASGMSPTIRLSHQLNGLEGIKAIKALDDSLENPKALEELCEKMAAIHAIMREAPRQFMIVAEEENISTVQASMGSAFGASPLADGFNAFSPSPVREQSKQLWTTSTEVNFSAKAYPTVPSAHEDSAALAVLGPFLRNGFLHRAIRETGGAYGGGASQDSDTASFRFYSYRDPRLVETLADFDASIEWLQTNKHEERELEESILNVISGIDKPGSPAGEARSTFQAELFSRTAERRRLFRQRILEVSLDDLKRVGQTYFDPTKASTGVVTSEGVSNSEDVAILGLDKHSL